MNVNDKDFKSIIDNLMEDFSLPKEAFYVDEEDSTKILLINHDIDGITVTKEKSGELQISFHLEIHPTFVAKFIRLLESLNLTYDIYEGFLYHPDTDEIIFESDIEIGLCPDCSENN